MISGKKSIDNIRGFTIVELLIVIVVIAILAAITVVAYNGIQARAQDSAITNDLASIKKKIELYKIDNSDLYPGGSDAVSLLSNLDIKVTKSAYATTSTTENNVWYCRNAARSMFSVIALSKSGKIFYVTDSRGPTQYTGAEVWSPTLHNCNTMISLSLGWQYAGYASSDTTNGPWRSWVGGN